MKQTVNERIKFLRSEMKITQRRFSELADVSEPTLHRIENTDSPISQNTLQKISDAFQVPMEWLESGKGKLTFVIPQEKEGRTGNGWLEKAAWEQIREENSSLREQLKNLTQVLMNLSSNLGKLDASNFAEHLRAA